MKIRPRQVMGQIICFAVLATSVASVNAQSVAAGEQKHGFCVSCHGIHGRSFKVDYPILAGQAAPYILRQLQDFKQSRRSDPIMNTIVPQLSDADMRDLAAFYSTMEPYSSPSETDPIKAIRGKYMAESAQCVSCHLGGGADSGASELPRIQGQHRKYMVKQLMDFKAGRRANDSGVMHRIAQSMTDTDIEDLGNYFAAMHFDSRQ